MKQSHCQKYIALGRILIDSLTWISHKEGIVNPLSEMIDKRLQAFIKHHLFMMIYGKLHLADIGGLLMVGMKYLLWVVINKSHIDTCCWLPIYIYVYPCIAQW